MRSFIRSHIQNCYASVNDSLTILAMFKLLCHGEFWYDWHMKTVLFVPGFREELTTRNYDVTLKAIEAKGYQVNFVPIKWERTRISDWVGQLDDTYSKYDPKNIILAGFSYGAMTAFVSAVRQNPFELWLFSLSPYFADDMPKIKKSWLSSIGHRRASNFKELDFNTLAKSITCKTLIVVGEVEAKKYPLVGNRANVASKAIPNSELVWVPKAGHDVTDKNYIKAIQEAI